MKKARPKRDRLLRYCKTFGRTPCRDRRYERLISKVLDLFLEEIGPHETYPPILVTSDGNYFAGFLSSPWAEGILVDESYLQAFESVLSALIDGEDCTDLALPIVRVVARQLEELGYGTEALALRHERLSALYIIDGLDKGTELLLDCADFEELIDFVRNKNKSARFGIIFVYVVLHEIGHYFFNTYSEAPPIRRAREEIGKHVREILAGELPAVLSEAAPSRYEEQRQALRSTDAGALTEEVFCDRFASSTMYLRAAKDGAQWPINYALLRLLQETKRLLDQSMHLAEDFVGDGGFLDRPPSLVDSVAWRGLDSLHVRAFLASGALGDLLTRSHRQYGGLFPGEAEEINETAERLFTQSLALFSHLTGPNLQRCLFLLLRATAAKLDDDFVRGFYEHLAKRLAVTTAKDAQQMIENILTHTADGLFD